MFDVGQRGTDEMEAGCHCHGTGALRNASQSAAQTNCSIRRGGTVQIDLAAFELPYENGVGS